MKEKKFILIILAVMAFLTFSLPGNANEENAVSKFEIPSQYTLTSGNDYVPDRVIVKFKDNQTPFPDNPDMDRIPHNLINKSKAAGILSRRYRTKIKDIRFHSYTGLYILETTEGCDIEALSRKLRGESFVSDASPDYYATLCAGSIIPNDPYFQYQYSLYNTGQVYQPTAGLTGTSGSDIKAPEGWQWTTGDPNHVVTIAIIDSGVSYNHEDLRTKIVPGYNFVDDKTDANDDHGHGTFVASIAAADTNNGVGIAGVCWNAQIMPIKVAKKDGTATYLAIAAGIQYAADHGAQVINISIGGTNPSYILENACQYAYNKNVVITASAGNYGAFVYYPAAYDQYVLAIAATDADDRRASFSNTGSQVAVAAPGSNVWGAFFDPAKPDVLNSYGFGSGTSFSSPYVAGAAALLLSYKPFLTNKQVMDLIKYTADDVNSDTNRGIDNFIGYGRINLNTLLGPYQPR
jgi:thermitase